MPRQISGDALGPTTGFMPPADWANDPLYNLKDRILHRTLYSQVTLVFVQRL